MSDAQQKLIDDLNTDLAHEYAAIKQYLTYAAMVSGPSRLELKNFFESEIPDETAHAQFLAGKIAALGGTPTTESKPVPSAESPKAMLEAVLAAETDAHDRYAARAAQAEQLGLKGLQVTLEDMARDESEHRDETKRILRRWED
ncbi:MAG: ferritin-like domain-containing protein [Planctomycetota bacterium]